MLGVWGGTSYETTIREEEVAGLNGDGSGTGQKQPAWDMGYLILYLGIGCGGEEGRDGFQSLTCVGKSKRRAGDSTGLS